MTLEETDELVGSRVTEIVTNPRVNGLKEQVLVKELAAITTRFLHPGISKPLTRKVTRPATEVVAEIFFAVRYTRLPLAIVIDEEEFALETVIVTLLLELAEL